MVLNEKPNRLLIFFFYDRAGIVDDYIPYMLSDIKENVSDILVVCNGELTDEGKIKFERFTDNILKRENVGFDVWAYKTAMESVGWEKLGLYDEIILMNFTMMGPVYPFRDMFDAMAQKDLDFWGITQFYKTDFDPWGGQPDGYIPDHIQSHFIAVRKDMINSDEFHDYWDNMPMINGSLDSVINHESKFTKYFEKAGFKWKVYADAEDFRDYSFQPCVGMAKRMIDEKKCPIFKRRSFMQDYDTILNESCGQEAYELYKYLDEKTDYDMNLLWDNLLRLENQADLKKNLQWNYILSSDTMNDKDAAKDKKIALVMHIHFMDLIPECARYASSMPDGCDMYLTTNTEEKKIKIEEEFSKLPHGKLDVRVVPNRGRDVGPFLVEFRPYLKDYDYVCHVHDKKAGQSKPGSIGLSFAYKCFENVLKSKEYVSNILDVFEKNERAGLLSPPPPNHSDYYFTLGLEWGSNYENTAKLAKELGMDVSIKADKEPIAPLGSFFWARAKALYPLFEKEWTYDDFPEEP
ncbi:MAG: rhamnan synthesis protein F, partial [Lachnospiraceae bacterium]|nr:rhamnan synthesis protein F [Lachnospiraceae bacterium]